MTDIDNGTALTVSQIASLVGGAVVGDDRLIHGVATLAGAGADDISFLANRKYRKQLATTGAGAVLVDRQTGPDALGDGSATLIQVDDPSEALTMVVDHFAPTPIEMAPGVDASAVVHQTAVLGEGVRVGPNAVVEAEAVVGANTQVRSGAVVGYQSRVGEGCLLHAGVVLRERVSLGDRVIVHANAVVGSDGFGYLTRDGVHHKIDQLGTVEVADDVEIGAGSTIDRGRFGATVIGPGTKIDNLVHIAHNVQIGRGALIIAQVGIAGSAQIGDYCILAGQSGVDGHIKLGAGSMLAGKSGATRDFPPGSQIGGLHGDDIRETLRQLKALRKLPDLLRQFSALQQEVERLASQSEDDQTA